MLNDKLEKSIAKTLHPNALVYKITGTILSIPKHHSLIQTKNEIIQIIILFQKISAQKIRQKKRLIQRTVPATESGSAITETATMELTVRLLEEAGFENISTTEYDKPYLYPYDPNDPTNAVVSKLNAQQGKVIGPSKVMAVKRSELLDVSTQYWYQEEPGETVIDDLSEIMAGVLLNLTGAGIGVIPSGPEQGLALINNVSGTQYNALETFITNSFDGIDLETSGAHLVYLFFNKQMQLDPTMSGRIAVGDANTLGQITQQSMRMPDDGFFYVYTTTLSARSYYFDKLTIKRWKPQVRVSYDYYPYGLTWNNPDLQDEENRLHDQTYQSKEFMFGENDGTVGLALYDFHARMYDPAMCRWLVPDPAAQFANPYLAMANNPVMGVDPDGRFVVTGIIVGAVIGGMISAYQAGAQGAEGTEMLKAAGIGMLTGAISGALGAYPLFGTGVGFLQGAGAGMVNGMATGAVTGGISAALQNKDILGGIINGGITGGIIGGITGGISGINKVNELNARDGCYENSYYRKWDGDQVDLNVQDFKVEPLGQIGKNNCVAATGSAINKSQGGSFSQETTRSWMGGDPEWDPINASEFWPKYYEKTNYMFASRHMTTSNDAINQILTLNPGNGDRVAISLINQGTEVGHHVALSKVVQKTITNHSGIPRTTTSFWIMNPAHGGYITPINQEQLLNTSRSIYFIFKP